MTPEVLVGDPAFGVVQVTFFDAFGNDLGTVETEGEPFPAKTSEPVDALTPPGEWTFLDTGPVTGPEGTAFIQAFTLYVDFTGNTQGVYFDVISLKALSVECDEHMGDPHEV